MSRQCARSGLYIIFKSLFSSFQFPCSYFLTRGVAVRELNMLFWKVSCCGGAPESRAFMVMNGCSKTVSKTLNSFSNLPLFLALCLTRHILMLRNNIYNSGHKEKSSRYSDACCWILRTFYNASYLFRLFKRQRHTYILYRSSKFTRSLRQFEQNAG